VDDFVGMRIGHRFSQGCRQLPVILHTMRACILPQIKAEKAD
jgi:hypothetical protein